jgi:hypothetical protein
MKIEDKFSLYLKWLRVFHFIEFLRLENYIEENTCDSMIDAMSSLKQLVIEDDD